MRRLFLIVWLLLVVVPAFAGKAKKWDRLLTATRTFDKALIERDSSILHKMTSPMLSFGHSNGWIENRTELITDLYNGKLVYQSIEQEGKQGISCVFEGNTALVRTDIKVDVLLDGKPMTLKLRVLQVWIYQKGDWKLIGRQSVRLG